MPQSLVCLSPELAKLASEKQKWVGLFPSLFFKKKVTGRNKDIYTQRYARAGGLSIT